MPATSLPAFGSLTPSAAIFSPRIAGVRNSSICSFVPRSLMTGVAMSLWTSRPIVTPAIEQRGSSSLFATREPVVAAGAAVLLGVVRAEDPELARALEDLVREDLGLLPLVGVRSELLLGELADGLAKLLVLFGERVGHGAILSALFD